MYRCKETEDDSIDDVDGALSVGKPAHGQSTGSDPSSFWPGSQSTMNPAHRSLERASGSLEARRLLSIETVIPESQNCLHDLEGHVRTLGYGWRKAR